MFLVEVVGVEVGDYLFLVLTLVIYLILLISVLDRENANKNIIEDLVRVLGLVITLEGNIVGVVGDLLRILGGMNYNIHMTLI